ncbi:MAG: transcriptional coactivator p15/PC4 family protein [Deltaproteobacteria bacterium]|nr:transcriptional coactivator p15/PC4 family protein [Deltaproteobacteria bacterium]MBW1995344.1 transcriptional coactivator p15/PC4 family protein [Deltaproteobacteria bacterium]
MSEHLYEIEKNGSELIRFSIREFKGHCFADIRLHFEDSEGTWRPTKKGITVPIKLLPNLVEGVKKLQEAARDE